ncbi:hypothetical protein AAFC00_002157 [Neodothiora populina]|uniref:SCP domain-containing protein n=1 Tax=Neodothiora populina TaxID=2781224 RepID=A0ABR3PGQ8_9PEZI
MLVNSIFIAALAAIASASPVAQFTSASMTTAAISVTVGVPTPLVTEDRLVARAALPTCNPNNVYIVKQQKPQSSAFCSSWRAAGSVHKAPLTVTGLNTKQISNICSCILTGKYVTNAPFTVKTSTTKTTAAAVSHATTYQQRVLVHHNVHRANHSASALTWSSSLANTAAKIANSCVYAHDVNTDGGGYGQNIAAGVTPDKISAVITDLFYNGEVNYYTQYGKSDTDMSNFEKWGHFSQVVWKSTTQVGCATVDCSAKGLQNVGSNVAPYFTVCNYGPPGNYLGQFGTQVGASLKKPTVQYTYGL